MKNSNAIQTDTGTNVEQIPTATLCVLDRRLAKAIPIPDPSAQATDASSPCASGVSR
ncbi:hypothetical protein ACPOL_0320 [Acidisarcina polymorpha]|uniref:Uncharacterized protein n=1 Tax=Acidisarcina polymorpha TaxID=2211140 RepID=A0A2Z5FSD2_9BACT|nr:hypothetical protein ACPOL_0320 [Acidisarcina polymorpha]